MSQLTPEVLKQITETRLKEAKILHEKGCNDGATYLCGYVLETALKALACKTLGVDHYPGGDSESKALKSSFYTHALNDLKILSGISPKLNMVDNPAMVQNWSLLTQQAAFEGDWVSKLRYTVGVATPENTAAIIKALDDPSTGFLTWMKTLW